VVTAAPGGVTDILARALGNDWERSGAREVDVREPYRYSAQR
jgi:hypothetical protein